MALPNLTDLKRAAQIPAVSTADDEELADALDSAVEMVAGIVGPLLPATVTEVHRNVNSAELVLRKTPVAALTSVSARYGSTLAAQPVGNYELDAETGIVHSLPGSRFWGTYVVEYQAGREFLPASIRSAILIVAEHLIEAQHVPMQGEEAMPPGFSGGIDAVTPTGRGFALPNRAIELLRPYATVSVA